MSMETFIRSLGKPKWIEGNVWRCLKILGRHQRKANVKACSVTMVV